MSARVLLRAHRSSADGELIVANRLDPVPTFVVGRMLRSTSGNANTTRPPARTFRPWHAGGHHPPRSQPHPRVRRPRDQSKDLQFAATQLGNAVPSTLCVEVHLVQVRTKELERQAVPLAEVRAAVAVKQDPAVRPGAVVR